MITKIYCVYDAAVETYLRPFHATRDGEALRAFKNGANDSRSEIAKNPKDYTLFEIGTFDDASGEFTMLPAKIPHGNALQYVDVKTEAQNAISNVP